MTSLISTAAHAEPKTVHPRRLLRISTAADISDVSCSTIRRAINAGHLDLVRVGRATAITAESFDRWLNNLPRVEKTPAA